MSDARLIALLSRYARLASLARLGRSWADYRRLDAICVRIARLLSH